MHMFVSCLIDGNFNVAANFPFKWNLFIFLLYTEYDQRKHIRNGRRNRHANYKGIYFTEKYILIEKKHFSVPVKFRRKHEIANVLFAGNLSKSKTSNGSCTFLCEVKNLS